MCQRAYGNLLNHQFNITLFFFYPLIFYTPNLLINRNTKGEQYNFLMQPETKHSEKSIVCCPECHGTTFSEDHIHAEIYCQQCGLVLRAPPHAGLVFPGVLRVSRRMWERCMTNPVDVTKNKYHFH
jgi:ribosomal protein S27E